VTPRGRPDSSVIRSWSRSLLALTTQRPGLAAEYDRPRAAIPPSMTDRPRVIIGVPAGYERPGAPPSASPLKARDDAELAYLISLQLPPRGTVRNVDELPFGLAP
jgi:hypothetical protein